MICCALGGDLEPDVQSTQTVQSRSMIAAYELVNAGFTNVKILAGGVDNWQETGRDLYLEGDEVDEEGEDQQRERGTDAAVQ